jgi:hypothetical protein
MFMPDTEEEQSSDELPQIHDANFSTIYSNWIQAGRTPWDIRLAFGQLREMAPDKPALFHMVNIVVAPQMAKALLGTIAAAIKQYEQHNGEIPIPLSIKQRLSASPSPSPSASPSPENDEED